MSELEAAQDNHQLHRYLKRFAAFDLVVVDEKDHVFGLIVFSPPLRGAPLWECLEDVKLPCFIQASREGKQSAQGGSVFAWQVGQISIAAHM